MSSKVVTNCIATLLLFAVLQESGRAQQVVHDCNIAQNANKTFVPWRAWQLSTKECIKGSDGKHGSCASENDCLAGKQGEPVLHGATVPKNTCKIEGAASASQCCVMKYNCTAAPAFTSTGGNSRSGTCIQPSFCSNAASKKTSSSACNSNSQLTCCVEEDPQSEGVQCTKRYPVVFNRIVKVQQKLDTDLNDRTSMSSNRITNFLPFAMKTFEDLRANKRCAPLGDCAAASYLAFFYHLLLDFTTPNPTPVLNEILSTLQRTAPAASDKLSNLLTKPEYSGHITPEAFGKMLEILWSDEQLNLLQYNSGSCADWIRISDAVRGSNSPWRCDKRWYYLTAAQYCRPTYTSNLADCGDGNEGVCYLDGNTEGVCDAYDLKPMSSGHAQCRQLYGERSFCCRKQMSDTSIEFFANKYQNVRVAIDPSIPENSSLIELIKEKYTEASSILYRATGERAAFGSIRIILPNTWSDKYANAPRSDEKLSNAEFVIKPDVNLDSDGLYSYTITLGTLQLGYCGSRGLGTFLTPKDLRGTLGAQNLAKHFSLNRYGIFKEFPRNEMEMEPRDAIKNPPHRCVKDNGVLLAYCDDKFEVNVEYQNYDAEGSLAWVPDYAEYPTLKKLIHFCDSRKCDGKRYHNEDIENTHNKLCNLRPTLDVIIANEDFQGSGNPPRKGISTVPKFVIVHSAFDGSKPVTTAQPDSTTHGSGVAPDWNDGETGSTSAPPLPIVTKTRFVLVLDQSGSMSIDNRIVNLRSAASQFVDLTDPNIETAVVSFDSSAYTRSDFRQGDSAGKEALKYAIFGINANGGTCIQTGLNRAVSLLAATGSKGGQIILMTDGENGCADFYAASMPAIEQQGATVHTVAITRDADPTMQSLAKDTGGSSFLIVNGNDVTQFLLQMQSILIQGASDESTQRVTIKNSAEEVQGQTDNDFSVLLDSGLGNDTLVSVLYDANVLGSMTGTMLPPVGSHGVSNVACVDEPRYGKLNCELKFKPTAGQWTLRVRPLAGAKSKVTVTASATIDTSATSTFSLTGIIVKPKIALDSPSNFWEKESLLDKSQAFMVTVSYGRFAVIGARVIAIIQHELGEEWREPLSDDGEGLKMFEGADIYESDGVYSALFNKFNMTGRYSVSIEVVAKSDQAFYTQDVLLGIPRSANFLAQRAAFRQKVSFTRVLSIGMFEVVKNTARAFDEVPQSNSVEQVEEEEVSRRKRDTSQSVDELNMLTPGRVTKMQLLHSTVKGNSAIFTFSWAAVGAHGMIDGHPTLYMLNASTNALEVQGRGDEIEVSPYVDGRLVSSKIILGKEEQTPGSPMMDTISLPLSYWKPGTKVYFAVTAYNSPDVDYLDEAVPGATSNILIANIESLEYGVCNSDSTGNCGSSPATKYLTHTEL